MNATPPPDQAQSTSPADGAKGVDAVAAAGGVAGEAAGGWSDADLTGNVHRDSAKDAKVRSMFTSIARSYDLNNRVHSLWRDQAWRRAAVRAAAVRAGDEVLDCACGTGDLTMAFAASPAARVVGTDFTPAMLDLAEHKRPRSRHEHKVSYQPADAMDLPFEHASFDVVSIAFGIRNVNEPERALAEFARVLRPGGRLVILEFDTPRLAPVRWFNRFYSGWVMPRTATLISGDRSGAYKYLPKSVGDFMSRERLLDAIGRAGFAGAKAKPLSLGICACYRAVREGVGPV